MSRSVAAEQFINIELITYKDDTRPVYITGNFNNWVAEDKKYLMTRVGKGKYRLAFPKASMPDILEYKYIKGSWIDVEMNEHGRNTTNRVVQTNIKKLKDVVYNWGGKYDEEVYPFKPIVQVISDEFDIPQLNRKRRIAAILPNDYHTSNKRYPVLYLQDGQNLYNDYAPFGTWGVDKSMTKLAEDGKGDVIIIAIDHGGVDRLEEFNPFPTQKLSNSQGRNYVNFLKDTLKPYIDEHFRTLTDRDNTAIGGSSMGGLITIYSGFRFPEVFGKLMVFSPSLWVNPNIHFDSMHFNKLFKSKIYMYAGAREGSSMIPLINHFKESLQRKGLNDNIIKIKTSIDPKGQHNEYRWGIEFPKAVKWLFFSK